MITDMSFPSGCFKRKEFECHCGCGKDTVDAELLEVLNRLRNHFGRPTIITSGYRCSSHNARVGGAKGSQHLTGRAADLSISGVSTIEIYNFLDNEYQNNYGIGLYSRWVHVDTRNDKARWGK